MVDFSKFDKMVNQEEIKKQMDSSTDFDDVPAGEYWVKIKAMEVKLTKDGSKVMFSCQMQITETVNAPKKQDKRYIFFNRVISGNKVSDKWNDGVAIKGIITWIDKLTEDNTLEFKNYSQFADDILDIFQDLADSIEVRVKYYPDNFYPISIEEVADL